MAPRTRANEQLTRDEQQESIQDNSTANQSTQLIRDSFDDNFDDLDLVQMADPSLLKSPVAPPKEFLWSDDGFPEGPASPKSGDGTAGNLWGHARGELSSAQSNRSVLPDTMPLPSHAHGDPLPQVDFSETASTAQRSSPFQTDDARQQLWDLDDDLDDDTGFLEDISNTYDHLSKSKAVKDQSLQGDTGHLSSSEIYEATPTKLRVVQTTPGTQEGAKVKKSFAPESSPTIGLSHQSVRAEQPAEIQRHKVSPAESLYDISDEIEDVAAILSKRPQVTDQVSTSVSKPKAVRRSKQRPKSPLKFNEDTQKIKSPNDKPSPKVATKPAARSAAKKTAKAAKPAAAKKAPTKTSIAKKPTRRSARKKAPVAGEAASDTVTVQQTNIHPPVLQQPTPKAQQEAEVQKASKLKLKAPIAPPESPIVLSSDHACLYQPSPELFSLQALQTPIVGCQPPPGEDVPSSKEPLATEMSTAESMQQQKSSVKSSRVEEPATEERLVEQKVASRHVVTDPLNQTQEIPSDPFQTFRHIRNRNKRNISVSDAGSPFAKSKKVNLDATKLPTITPQHIDDANTDHSKILNRTKYTSPLFQVVRNQRERRTLIESPDTPNRSARRAAGPPSFVLHEKPKPSDECHRKSSDWARILSLNKNGQTKKPQGTSDDASHGTAMEVENAAQTRDRQPPSADNESTLTHKIHTVAESMIMHLKGTEANVKGIPAVYQDSVLGCIEKLMRRFEDEERQLKAGCKRDYVLFLEQLEVVRNAVEDGRCKRRKVLEDAASKFNQRRTDGETELLKVRQLYLETKDRHFEREIDGAEDKMNTTGN